MLLEFKPFWFELFVPMPEELKGGARGVWKLYIEGIAEADDAGVESALKLEDWLVL